MKNNDGIETPESDARKQAEAHLKQQWRTFDAALANTPDLTYTFDLEGRFSYANRALLVVLGKSLEEVVGKNFFDLGYPTELAARLQRQIQEIIDGKNPVRDHTPYAGASGEIRHYEYIFAPILAADGHVEAVAGSTRDVTEQKEAAEALRKSEERLTLALEAGGGVGTWDWEIPSDRVYCNAQFARLYSIAPERAAAGIPVGEFVEQVHPEDRAHVSASIQRAVETGGEYAEEYRLMQVDGSTHWVYSRGRCHLDATGRAVRFPGVVLDISERKQVEEALLKANRELEEFAYVASHDLQEPLRMVSIYAQMIARRISMEDPTLIQYTEFMQQGVARMEALIEDLLTFSRAVHDNEPPLGMADLAVAFEEGLLVLKSNIEESGAVISVEPLPMVRADTPQMAHVFQNLISNALKYRKKESPPEIHITAERVGNEWIVSVKDHGIGFEQRYAERIFGLFKRLHKAEYPGTGLGLAICKRIVERYGGRIWAEGISGEGATFRFQLTGVEG
jgi:PAS domain S-box-containing protein